MTYINQIVLFEKTDLFWSWIPDFIGCLGAMVVLIAYALLQTRKIEAESLLYSLLNLGGAIMILTSLLYSWNLAAVAMEIAWLFISLFGIFKIVFRII